MSLLIVFDIDGTLTKTNVLDEACFSRAAAELMDYADFKFHFQNNWHFTDSYISFQLSRLGKNRFSEETFKNRFLHYLDEEAGKRKFEAVSGAQTLLQYLRENNHPFSLATGCWRKSAEIKLKAAGFEIPDCPIATADNYFTRDEIVTQAIVESHRFYNTNFTDVVYIGDGYWDLVTCNKLALRFIGIDAENNPKKAEQLGAHLLLQDYPAPTQFIQLLHKAVVPTPY